MLVKRGLRKSTYPTDADGKPCAPEVAVGKGSTFYLNV